MVDASTRLSRPHSSLLKQQRLPAWQPILTPPHVTACFLLTAAIFIPIGVAILKANDTVIDLEFRYDNAMDGCFAKNVTDPSAVRGCKTYVSFDMPTRMTPPVYLYYKLTNFYQNHRRYSGSRLDAQLAGNEPPSDSSDADPFFTVGAASGLGGARLTLNGVNRSYAEFVYSPAGLIAWSLFNDTFTLYRVNQTTTAKSVAPNAPKVLICNGSDFSRFSNLPNSNMSQPLCHKKGIAWASDVSDKFKTPLLSERTWTAPRGGYGSQPLATNDSYYRNGWYAGEAGHLIPSTLDEDLMVWMRAASLPQFRKLYRVIDVPLEAGTYVMEIQQEYDVSSFSGTKSFALANLSWVGGKNPFLAMVYLIVGCVAFAAAIVFAVIHFVCGDRTQRAIDELMHDSH